MVSENVNMFYQKWVDSDAYDRESPADKEEYKEPIIKIISEGEYRKIDDAVMELACKVQYESFAIGFRYGISFMSDILRGGAAG